MNQNTKPIIFKRSDVVNLWERSLPFFEKYGASHTNEDLLGYRGHPRKQSHNSLNLTDTKPYRGALLFNFLVSVRQRA